MMKRMSRDDIAHVLQRGARVHGLLCTYACRPHEVASFSVVVSKKVSPTAVGRNRIKRRMRAALRAAGSVGMVVAIAKPGAREATVAALMDEARNKLKRAV